MPEPTPEISATLPCSSMSVLHSIPIVLTEYCRTAVGHVSEVAQPPGYDFVFVMQVALEQRHFNAAHLYAGSASEILIDARNAWLRAVAWPRMGPEYWLIIRHLAIDYVSEAFFHEDLMCGVAAVSRTRKTVQLHLCVWEARTQRVVLRGTIADVGFLPIERRAVDIDADLWATIQAYEGRRLPHFDD
jgi:acyl-CoA thioesterase FadM